VAAHEACGVLDFLFANACSRAQVQPCNNAIGLLNTKWQDPELREQLDLTPSGSIPEEEQWCIVMLRRLQPPIGEQDLIRAVDAYRAKLDAERSAREVEEGRRRRQAAENANPILPIETGAGRPGPGR